MLKDDQKLLRAHLKSFSFLTTQDIERFVEHSTKRNLKKSEYFIRMGQVCTEVVFVLKGTLRSFHVSDKEEEITYCITFPNNLTTAYSSFITGEGSLVNIQAVTPVDLLIIPKKKIDQLAEKYPNWVKFLKIIAEHQYVELQNRMFQLQKSSTVKRYRELAEKQPELIKNIPLRHLASYLGVTSRHLSRIRKGK